MGLMDVDVSIKNMKMRSTCRHLCLFILLFSVVISLGIADDQSSSRGNSGGGKFDRLNLLQLNTKNNNRNLSEISVLKPQTPHHHFRHQNSHSSAHQSKSGGSGHKQHNHQSNDNAFSRIPDTQRQTHLPKKYSYYEDKAATIGGGGAHIKNQDHTMHHRHQQQKLKQHQQPTPHRPTTLGPFRSRAYNQGDSAVWSYEANAKRNFLGNRQSPDEFIHLPMGRNQSTHSSFNSNWRLNYNNRRFTTTTTTTTTTTLAPDIRDKIFFDGQNFNDIDDNDDVGDDEDLYSYSDNESGSHNNENYDTRKRSPSISTFDRHDAMQLNDYFQRDDPARSTSYNGISTSIYQSKHSSNGGNYHFNVNNDGSTNQRPTIETSKPFIDDVKTNSMTQNIQNRNGYDAGALTKEKLETLSTRVGVHTAYEKYNDWNKLAAEASVHVARVRIEGKCKWPRPKIIPVEKHISKTYNPHCTILHRCGDDTGCCSIDSKTCVALSTTNVTLPFMVRMKGFRPWVELLTFENHTECHCVSIQNSQDPEPALSDAINMPDCRCPSNFVKTNGPECKCDCPHLNADDLCNQLKKGQEHFSLEERRCINNSSCEKPTCLYGDYNSRAGHCPRKDEV